MTKVTVLFLAPKLWLNVVGSEADSEGILQKDCAQIFGIKFRHCWEMRFFASQNPWKAAGSFGCTSSVCYKPGPVNYRFVLFPTKMFPSPKEKLKWKKKMWCCLPGSPFSKIWEGKVGEKSGIKDLVCD